MVDCSMLQQNYGEFRILFCSLELFVSVHWSESIVIELDSTLPGQQQGTGGLDLTFRLI